MESKLKIQTNRSPLDMIMNTIRSIQVRGEEEFGLFYEKIFSKLSRPETRVQREIAEIHLSNPLIAPQMERIDTTNSYYQDCYSDLGSISYKSTITLTKRNHNDSMLHRLAEEAKRLDRLETKMALLKRKASLLAQTPIKNDESSIRRVKVGRISKNKLTPTRSPSCSPTCVQWTTPIHHTAQSVPTTPLEYGSPKTALDEFSNARIKSVEILRTPPRLNKRTLSHINQGRVQKSHKLPAHVGIWSDPTNSFWTTETKSHNTPSFNQQLERAKQMDD
ncbi:hypothetical protein G6F56_001262 [Rhizopus delemar]|nr:hypothetical protein G6F56_001262 [Rhizopus delemar]